MARRLRAASSCAVFVLFAATAASFVAETASASGGDARNPTIRSLSADPSSTNEGAVVRFEAEIESPDPSSVTFDWDFGDGSTPIRGVGAAAVQHRFPDGAQNGTSYTVTLTVTDSAGASDQATTSIAVANVAPRIVGMQRDGAGLLGASMPFLGQAVDPGVDDALTFTWDFGDGGTGTGPQVDHQYAAAGRYTVTLDVDDGDGGSDQRTMSVIVGEGGEMSVSGGVGIPTEDLTSSIVSAVSIGDGLCQFRLELGIEDAGIGFQVMLPGGLAPGTYRIGPTTEDAGLWDDEVASPGTFTATAAVDPAYDPPERGLFGFWSVEGTFTVEHFDGERLEASFAVELQERTVRSANPPPYWIDVEGWVAQAVDGNVLGGPPASGPGGFYLCDVGTSPMTVVSLQPSDRQPNVDLDEPVIKVGFDVPIDETTLNAGTFRLGYRLPDRGASGAQFALVEGGWAAEPDGTHRFVPSGPLLAGVSYQAVIRGGLQGVRGARGEMLAGNTSWNFTTLVEPTVRVAVFQVARNAPLIPGKTTAARVWVDWQENPNVHQAWQTRAFPARIDVKVDGAIAWPVRDEYPNRPDQLSLEDSAQARNSVNFFGWTPSATSGTSSFVAAVEPTMQQIPVPRRFESAPVEIVHHPGLPPLEYEARRLRIRSWTDAVPPELDQLMADVMREGAAFTAQNFPVPSVSGSLGDLALAEPPTMFQWSQGNLQVFRGWGTAIKQDEYFAKQAYDLISPTTSADLLVLFMPAEVQPTLGGYAYTDFPGVRTVSIFVAPAVGPQSLQKNAGVVAHEFGHALGLPHYSRCADDFRACLSAGKAGSDDVEGFRLAPDGSRGWNKSKLEGNAEAPTTKTVISLMHPDAIGLPGLFIANRQYDEVLRGAGGGPPPAPPGGRFDSASPFDEPGYAELSLLAWDVARSGPSASPGGDLPALETVPSASRSSPTLQDPEEVLLTGVVLTETGTIAVAPPRRLERPWTHHIPGGEYTLEVRDAGGGVLHTRSFGLSPATAEHRTDLEGRAADVPASAGAWFWVTAPHYADAREYVVRRGSDELMRLGYTEHAPTVAVDQLRAESDGTLQLAWTHDDGDGDVLAAMVTYSPDGTGDWRAISPWMEGTTWAFDPAPLPVGPSPTLRLIVSDGFREGEATVPMPGG